MDGGKDALHAFVRGPATWYGYLLVGANLYMLTVQGNVLPFLQTEFGLPYRVVALHSTAIAVGAIMVGLFGARVVQRLGRRTMMAVAGCGLGVSGFLLAASHAPWASIGSCFLIGSFSGFIPSIVAALFSDLHGVRRSQAYAEQSISSYSFAILGPLVTGACLAVGLGWRTAVVAGGLVMIGIVIAFRGTPLPNGLPPPASGHRRLPPAYWAYWALLGFACAYEFCILLWAPAFLERVVGLSATAAATAAAAFFGGVLAGRITLAIIIRRVPMRAILSVAFAIGFVGFAFYWIYPSPILSIIGIALLGVSNAPCFPISTAFAMGSVPNDANTRAGTRLTLAFGIAILTAPAALGAIADVAGLRTASLAIPVLFAAALASFLTGGYLERRAVRLPA